MVFGTSSVCNATNLLPLYLLTNTKQHTYSPSFAVLRAHYLLFSSSFVFSRTNNPSSWCFGHGHGSNHQLWPKKLWNKTFWPHGLHAIFIWHLNTNEDVWLKFSTGILHALERVTLVIKGILVTWYKDSVPSMLTNIQGMEVVDALSMHALVWIIWHMHMF
jgi:hypothetical protein